MTYAESDIVAEIERLAQTGLATLTQAERDQFDQFHSGGSEAVDRLLPSLQLTPEMTVLDIGSGFGGPARQVARASGCRVVGVDITTAYVAAAEALTETAGLADRVTYVCADVSEVGRSDFDAAYTMHVQMNVADKGTFFSQIARRLRPGARLATYEVCIAGASQPKPPLPWSLDGSDSYLASADQLRETIVGSGFEADEWVDETSWVIEWFQDVGARMAASRNAATLPALLADGPARMMNFASALATGVLSVHRGAFTRSAPRQSLVSDQSS